MALIFSFAFLLLVIYVILGVIKAGNVEEELAPIATQFEQIARQNCRAFGINVSCQGKLKPILSARDKYLAKNNCFLVGEWSVYTTALQEKEVKTKTDATIICWWPW